MSSGALILTKEERLCSKTLIDKLFKGGNSKSVVAFPLRVVYLAMEETDSKANTQILISVPKKCFKRAVKRNRVKRQVREAYRHHKDILSDVQARPLLLAFIWLDGKLHSTQEVNTKVENLLQRVKERI